MTLFGSTLVLIFISVGYHRAQTEAMNLGSVWLLPEEGYPVFYRYFRDRITWYEADAVCQFHHGQLITVDTSKQFDAARAYLKELDVANFVWTGLKKTSSKQNFLWPESKAMENPEGHWAVEVPKMNEPLCAAIDPSSDYRWQPLPCSGPTVAAFVCQMQVPSWAMKEDGCMITSLPSLTVTFLPEEGAVELSSDCGLDGTRRIACKGKTNREDIMRQLSCETSTESSSTDSWSGSTRHRRSEVTSDMTPIQETQEMLTEDEMNVSSTIQTVLVDLTTTKSPDTTVTKTDPTTTVRTTESVTVATTVRSTTASTSTTTSTHAPIVATGQPEVVVAIVNSRIGGTDKRQSKPIPPSLKGNSPWVDDVTSTTEPTSVPYVNATGPDETEGPAESHELLSEDGPSRTPPSARPTSLSLEQYEKNVQDSGEDHSEDPTNTTNFTTSIPQTTSPANSEMNDAPNVAERPNRNRSLIRPQHRSFYPYFLNRVLG